MILWMFRLLVLALAAGMFQQTAIGGSNATSQRPAVVIVHGAWGGGWDWKTVADAIGHAGYRVYRPTLTGQGARAHLATKTTSLSLHIQDILNELRFENLQQVILVGHSYGGMVITGVADREPGRVAGLVYIDALIPENGESVFDLQPALKEKVTKVMRGQADSWLVPPFWEHDGMDTPQPYATLTEKITLGRNSVQTGILPLYILTREKAAATDAFDPAAARAKQKGWQVKVMTADHNPQRSAPYELSRLILSHIQSTSAD